MATGMPYAQPPVTPTPMVPREAAPRETGLREAGPQPVPDQPDPPAASQSPATVTTEPATTGADVTEPATAGAGGPEFAQTSPVASDFHPRGGGVEDPPEDPQRVLLRKQLDALRVRAGNASSWLERSGHYAKLVNRDGIVPVTTRLTVDDIDFLGRAREEVLSFTELGLRLLELHAPLDAGGISTDPSSPILRCRSCMWRWPCPTFSMLSDALGQMPNPGTSADR